MRKFAWVAAMIAGCCSCVRYETKSSRHKVSTAQLPTPRSELREAVNTREAGAGSLDLRRLRQKMEADPENLQTRLELATYYEQGGYPEIAIEHYRLAAQRFPLSEEVQVRLAKVLRAEGLTATAVDGLELFAHGNPHCSSRVPAWIGILRDELGNLQLAELAHREALKRDPGSDSLHNNLGYNLLLQGRKDAAAAEFRQALNINRHSPVAANNLATALASDATGPEAAQRLATITDPATAHNNLGAILMDQGRYPEARRELMTALGHNRNHAAALKNLALLAELDGKPAALPSRKSRASGRQQERP